MGGRLRFMMDTQQLCGTGWNGLYLFSFVNIAVSTVGTEINFNGGWMAG
jgi:hypothetical protein